MVVLVERRDLTASDLRNEARRSSDGGQIRRLLALALVLEGASRTAAAEACGMDRQTLRDWVHRYNAKGVAGLVDRPSLGSGTPPKLSAEQLAELAVLVEAGPDVERDGVVRWRRVDLRDVIKARFGVDVHERTVGKLLNRLGFAKLTARAQHPKSDLAAQETFKKTSPGC